MKWTYSIKQKTTTALLLAVVLGLVLLNNLYQSRQFKKIADSFSSLYEDRLIAESYIYRISELLHQKNQMLEKYSLTPDPIITLRHEALQSSKTISNLIDQYKKTKFTRNERRTFDILLSGMEKLVRVEKEYLASELYSENNSKLKDSVKTLVGMNLQYLSKLSDIQVNEGGQMAKISKETLASNVASSELEAAFLIIIAIIIQMLIFASNSMHSLLKQKPGLN